MNFYFHYVREFLACSKNRAVLNLINQLYAGVVIKKCSTKKSPPNFQKIVRNRWKCKIFKKHLWKNSFLIEMQVFGMRIYYTCKIKFMKFLNRCLSTIFLKFFKNSYFAEYLSMSTTLHGLRCLCICCSLGMFQDYNVVQDCIFK